ncbi:hypothetical protein KJ865_08420, partial [Myxococcota bacterium]|nr:hypothetical protein [Myxococcota bacterium]
TEIINREYELFPLIKDCELRPETAHSRLRHYYHKLISRFKSDIDSVFLALPVEINHKGVAQPSSYQGMGGNLSTLFSLSAQTPVYVLNDAEAAAVGSHEYLHGKSLVLTVGSGLGGCLCHEIF